MLESARDYFKGWFEGQDQRKKEHGSLDNWRRRHVPGNRSGVSHRIRKQATRRNPKSLRSVKPSSLPASASVWNRVKSVFSPKDQDLQQMRNAYADFKLQDHTEKTRTRAEVQRRIATSTALKRKMQEKHYDDKLLEELRRGRNPEAKPVTKFPRPRNFETDQVIILQHKVDSLVNKITSLEQDLQLTRKKLMFAREKNSLLESLLDDANVDSDYVKSRRRITNLQKENLKPDFNALPLSPKRDVSPLFTSSPIRLPNVAEEDPLSDYYEKYPRIPDAELLKKDPESSLSPIRLDLSKYSNFRERRG
ncbi:LANO_0H00606g1_1 [Lachancea nothofagi CBS 11611]|uniref:LANO_0H00606g1_1 n=1 Tax=Lachancea nothofagi CBS 11611 TaxID=1266666 RepID=A0A1G4KL24_9SACH|nr:LANO_0H00606g1_1 [Lachancea nothofagi CBS 11611]